MFDLIELRNLYPQLTDFYISAKEMNFAEAGRKNNITPSSLGRSVAKLESALDLKLINSSNTGFTLTIDGQRLFDQLTLFFNNKELFKLKDINDHLDVVITIGTTRNISDYYLAKYLTKFNKLYPDVKINILTDSASNLNDYLNNYKIDFLIDYLPNINFSKKLDFEIKPISRYVTCFACSKSYYEKIKDNIKSIKDLDNYKLVIQGSSRRRQMLDEILQENNIKLCPTLQMPDSRLMAEIVKNNDFIGYFIEEEVEDFGLVKLNIQEELPINNIGIIYPKKTINKSAKDFIKLATEDAEL